MLLSKHRSAIRIAGFLLTCAYSGSPAASNEVSSFEFRGARLGMTIEEFEGLPELGTMRLSEYNLQGKKTGEGRLTRCNITDEKVNAQIGIMDCKRAGDDPFTPQKYKYIYTSIEYKFGPDSSGKKRLFSILVITGRENYDEAISGLRSKWGNGKLENSTVTNGLGQPLSKSTEKWRKSGQTIELESLCGTVTTICITYSNDILLSDLAIRRAAITGGAASRF